MNKPHHYIVLCTVVHMTEHGSFIEYSDTEWPAGMVGSKDKARAAFWKAMAEGVGPNGILAENIVEIKIRSIE
jgi:hypothetical protein